MAINSELDPIKVISSFLEKNDLGYWWKVDEEGTRLIGNYFDVAGNWPIIISCDGDRDCQLVFITYEGVEVTPVSLVNQIMQRSRDAWHVLWIRRPGETGWHLADDMRRRIRKAEQNIKELVGT